MKPFSFTTTSDHFLLCVSLSLLWVVTGSNSSSSEATTSTLTTTMTTTPSTTLSTTKAPPGNVSHVTVLTQNDTSITLEWKKVDNIPTYFLQYEGNISMTVVINATNGSSVQYVVSPLTAGRKYKFTLITSSEGVKSTGFSFEAATAPLNAEEFKSVNQTETSITLRWKKVDKILKYKLDVNGKPINVTASGEGEYVNHTISNLTCGIKYNFTLFTEFENVTSFGVNCSAPTAPCNAEDLKSISQTETSITLQWKKVDNILDYKLDVNGTMNVTALGNEYVNHTIANLTCGIIYNFTLFTEFENVTSSGVNYSAPTAPCDAEDFKSIGQTETSITLQWKKVDNILDYKLDVNGEPIYVNASGEKYVTKTIPNLTCGIIYNFTLFTEFENVTSSGVSYSAPTGKMDFTSLFSTFDQVTSSGVKYDAVTDRWFPVL